MTEDPRIRRLLTEGAAATPLITLPGDTFPMGSHERPDEAPVHEVTVGSFAVALTPVSNREWAQFLAASDHEPPRFWSDARFNQPGSPVVGVNWFDAVAYCEWLSITLDERCRLPTEAEREYAARGGVPEVLFPWGDEPWSEGAHAFGAAGADRQQPLGSSPPNGFGLYHMADNVHEWCSDWYQANAYTAAPALDPRGPADGERRASRGGSWRHRIKVSRIAARSSLAPERRYNDYGLRVYADR